MVKLLIQKIYMYILYANNDRKPRTCDYTQGSGQAVTGLHHSPLREAGPLTHNIMSHNYSCLFKVK
jgi:hypothetical protein